MDLEERKEDGPIQMVTAVIKNRRSLCVPETTTRHDHDCPLLHSARRLFVISGPPPSTCIICQFKVKSRSTNIVIPPPQKCFWLASLAPLRQVRPTALTSQ